MDVLFEAKAAEVACATFATLERQTGTIRPVAFQSHPAWNHFAGALSRLEPLCLGHGTSKQFPEASARTRAQILG